MRTMTAEDADQEPAFGRIDTVMDAQLAPLNGRVLVSRVEEASLEDGEQSLKGISTWPSATRTGLVVDSAG